MESYMTIEELARYLKVAEQTIRRWVLNREIPFCKIKKVIRFRLSEIESWVDNRGQLSGAGKNDEIKKSSEKRNEEADLFGENKGGEA